MAPRAPRVFEEQLVKGYHQGFSIDRVLFEHRTPHQELLIFENHRFGRMMALDGIVQTTEGDEFIYHETLVHVPLFAHAAPRRVLIIGGGDGGSLREVARHAQVERIVQVEIDAAVIETCREHLPNHSAGAFADPRLEIVIADGMRYVAETDESFDVIICDSTDPVGPGAVLFSGDFYAGCKRCLAPGGVLVTQNGVVFFQEEEAQGSAHEFARLFEDWTFFSAPVPSYVGGIMLLGWATDDPSLRQVPAETLRERYRAAGFRTRWYNPDLHRASFALPQYVLDFLAGE